MIVALLKPSGPAASNVSLWTYWDAITCPVLVLRARAPISCPRIATEMTRRSPKAELIEIPGCGHAPALLDDDQIALVLAGPGWLDHMI